MTEATSDPESRSPGTAGAIGDPLQAGRDAFARRTWSEAFDLLSAADREQSLSGADTAVSWAA